MRRMLDPTKVGGIPSTIEFDEDGNRNVKKNLGVDGKLTLKSLVSDSNPDGDITKELGGGGSTLYRHFIKINKGKTDISINCYRKDNTKLDYIGLNNFLKDASLACVGILEDGPALYMVNTIFWHSETTIAVNFISLSDGTKGTYMIDGSFSIDDKVTPAN